MNNAEVKEKIETDPNFIGIRRFRYSLQELESRYPDGAPDHIIAAALRMTQEEVDTLYVGLIKKIRQEVGVKSD